MTEQHVSETVLVRVEAFGESRTLEAPGGSRDDLERLEDPVLERRARHVLEENARVYAMVAALHDLMPASCRWNVP